jgi:hypothetical protein
MKTHEHGPDLQTKMRLFLCGDVMTGRGIDQVLAHRSGYRTPPAIPAEPRISRR